MAGPVQSFVQLPLDTGNTGKKIHTTSVVVGSDTVHRHHYVTAREKKVIGIYSAVTALLSTAASAHNGTSTGHLWFQLPAAQTNVRARIRRVIARHAVSAATPTMPTMPRVALARFSFSGTPSGAVLTPSQHDPDGTAPVADVRTAVTGLTVTVGALVAATLTPTAFLSGTAASFMVSPINVDPILPFAADEDEWPIIKPGNGLLFYQPDAATTSDTRRLTFDIIWDEIDVA